MAKNLGITNEICFILNCSGYKFRFKFFFSQMHVTDTKLYLTKRPMGGNYFIIQTSITLLIFTDHFISYFSTFQVSIFRKVLSLCLCIQLSFSLTVW